MVDPRDVSKSIEEGTVNIGIVVKDGVVLGADQMAAMGNYFISDEDVKKLFKITNRIAMSAAGGAGVNQILSELLKAEAKLYELENGEMSVKAIISLFSNIIHNRYESVPYAPYQVHNMIAGFDKEGPKLFTFDGAGSAIQKKYATTGAGMIISQGILDQGFKEGMSQDEGVKLCVKAIDAAKRRILGVGGESMDIFVITKEGIREVSKEEIKKLSG